MLEYLRLKNVGPAPEMEMELAPRLNLITGDNGLGKSFLLDVAWWALTRSWARQLVVPRPARVKPTIEYRYTKKTRGPYSYVSTFDRRRETWSIQHGRPAIPGLVLYAQVDGGFSVWDPARNYWRKDAPDRPASFLFAPTEVWEGNALCEGLVRDWASWQREGGIAFEELQRVLARLAPGPDEPLQPGALVKLSIDDPKRYPTLAMPYGQDVAVVHASAGMRRIIALAYLLVWAWQEHLAAAALLGNPPAKEVIFLIDETEAHLHPKWQLHIVPALLEVMDALTEGHGSRAQLITTTHSPLVLTSAEPGFDTDRDAWFDMDLETTAKGTRVVLQKRPFARLGTAGRWLTSNAFDLPSEGRAPRAAELLEEAGIALSDESFDRKKAAQLDERLRGILGDTDPFWIRWRFVGEQRGWLPEPPQSSDRSLAHPRAKKPRTKR
ncbi:MAG: AAA family ATPase [Thermoanaerobaculia bacterium]|nr:AAA family ATPase [Thermoanaerobaculia bacterium]